MALDALDDGEETIELITWQRCDVDEIAYLLARLEDFLLHDDDYTADHVSHVLINDGHDGSPPGSANSPVTCAASRSQSARTSALIERRDHRSGWHLEDARSSRSSALSGVALPRR